MRVNPVAAHFSNQDSERASSGRTPEARARDRVLPILEKATALVAMADRGGALFYVNPAGRRILGFANAHEVSASALIECVALIDRTRIANEAIPAALAGGAWSGNCALQGRDGRQIEVTLLITAHRDENGQPEGLSFLAQDMCAWASTSAALRISQNELLQLSAQHMTIQENERRRIAADLHDGLGQSLGLLIMSLESLSDLLDRGESEKAAQCLERLKPKARDTLDDLRRIAMNLRPATLDSLGVLATLSWHLREIEAACPGIRIDRQFGVDESDVPVGLRTAIFRILQEAGSNAIKHGRADHVSVRLNKPDGGLELIIEDNGAGFHTSALSGSNRQYLGLGLRNMRERAELSCGVCEIESTPGKGTRVSVRWPSSLSDSGLHRAAALAPETKAVRDLGFSKGDKPGDVEMLRNPSVCVACVSGITGDV